jgi:hypothetical protein
MSMIKFKEYKPSVGDEMYIVEERAIGNRKAPSVQKSVVESVGVKYFTLKAMPSSKFHIYGKKAHANVNSFPISYRLYPSEDVYDEQVLGVELLKAVASKFGSNNRSFVEENSIEEIKKACGILGVTINQPNHK